VWKKNQHEYFRILKKGKESFAFTSMSIAEEHNGKV
jgi:hypothetical protein